MKRFILSALLFSVASTGFAATSITGFTLPWANHPVRGTTYATTDHADGVYVLEFAANFCGACNENAPNVDQMATAYAADARVQVLDVMLDQSDSEITRWIARHRPNHPVLKDVGRGVWNQLNEQYIPTMVVTDCKGEIKFRFTGVWDSSVKAEIKAAVDGLLAETCSPE